METQGARAIAVQGRIVWCNLFSETRVCCWYRLCLLTMASVLGPLVDRACALSIDRNAGENAQSESESTREEQDFQHFVAIQGLFREVADRVKPFLVRIETVGGAQPVEIRDDPRGPSPEGEIPSPVPRPQNPFRDSPGGGFQIADGPTTGMIYSSDGYILTSSFNFVREPALVSVTLTDGRRLAADVVARDQVRKLAMLKIDAENLPVPEWAPVDEVRVGKWAVALGLGFGGTEPSISVGVVSALNRMTGNAFQSDVKISPANYGGPVCDLTGRVMGIAVPMAQRPGELAGIEMYDSGVGFALPRERVDQIASALRAGRSFYRGWLGMTVDPQNQDAIVILNVADPSPLRTAGAKPGDKIVQVEGKDVRHFGELVQATYMIPAGDEIYVTLERKGIQFGVKLTLARNIDLGPLPEIEEPLDPSVPAIPPTDESVPPEEEP